MTGLDSYEVKPNLHRNMLPQSSNQWPLLLRLYDRKWPILQAHQQEPFNRKIFKRCFLFIRMIRNRFHSFYCICRQPCNITTTTTTSQQRRRQQHHNNDDDDYGNITTTTSTTTSTSQQQQQQQRRQHHNNKPAIKVDLWLGRNRPL